MKKTKTKTKKPVTLPDKLSELLRLAVKDSMAVAKMKTRKLAMGSWLWKRRGVCEMCMAGAVMDRTLRCQASNRPLFTEDLGGLVGEATAYKLMAIDRLRTGNLFEAAELFDLNMPDELQSEYGNIVSETWIENSRRATWQGYLAGAKLLEAHGY